MKNLDKEILKIKDRLVTLENERSMLMKQLEILQNQKPMSKSESRNNHVTHKSPSLEKIALFKELFKGREDVFPGRWENPKSGKSGYSPVCGNEWVPSICNKPKVKCSICPHQAFKPVTNQVIRNHLMGYDPKERTNNRQFQDFTIGVYPMLHDETCWFLAADFDKEHWLSDVKAFLDTCKKKKVPAVLERSRSGKGGHVWIFFSEPIPAIQARKLGSLLLTEAMESRPELGFNSYDRFFPNQDTLPKGRFGNLIALPLQRKPAICGNTLFLDENFEPAPDQWEFLSSIKRISVNMVNQIVDEANRCGQILGVRMIVDDDSEKPWSLPPSRRLKEKLLVDSLPDQVTIVIGNQLYIEKEGLPPNLVNNLIKIAAFQNPEFYKAQAMRLPTFGKPRIISCAELYANHIGLPRGCLDEVKELMNSLRIPIHLREEQNLGERIEVNFRGTLSEEQQKVINSILPHEMGVIAATTAFGKTVIAINLISTRKRNTLILVHRRQLLDQWIEKLHTFLDLGDSKIGQIGSGIKKPCGTIDVALIQSLVKKHEVDDIVAEYGHVIFDECHHISAVSFETVARQCKAKYILGLTATAKRKDGHHPIIFMQCGPIRYQVDPRKQAKKRPFLHKVFLRYTDFGNDRNEIKDWSINEIYRELMNDNSRNEMIISDVLLALKNNRSPLVLTERREHVSLLAERLSPFIGNVIVLKGGLRNSQRYAIYEKLSTIKDNEKRVLIATGRYLGEGFDDARLDTLFLTMPISWRGTLAQYAGRLHRIHHAKKEVIIYDYVDRDVQILERMSEKRLRGYRNLGYEIEHSNNSTMSDSLFDMNMSC